jgi:hypothetical protein
MLNYLILKFPDSYYINYAFWTGLPEIVTVKDALLENAEPISLKITMTHLSKLPDSVIEVQGRVQDEDENFMYKAYVIIDKNKQNHGTGTLRIYKNNKE